MCGTSPNGKIKAEEGDAVITADKYIEGINSIYIEQPAYETGHDGSDGKCDCIGMCRGALKREGLSVSGLSGTNYAARHTIKNLQQIENVGQLRPGYVVLKTRDKDDSSMPLPDKYRKGGADYSSKWGETNFSHIGTVTSVSPLEITHMTSPTAKKDTSLGKWTYFGQLPWVGEAEETENVWAVVWAEKGSTVKMRAKPSTSCKLYWDVPIGSSVILREEGETWSRITWAGQDGYMMSKFLFTDGKVKESYTVTIHGIDRETAELIITQYGGEMTVEKG